MIKKYQASANIYNYQIRTGITQSAYLNKNGEQITNVSYEISYPIAIKPNTTYTWQFGGTTIHAAPTVCFYDSSDNLISGVAHTGGTYFSFNSPSNAAYLKASVYTSSANQAVLHEGSTFIDYVPYGLTAIDWFYRKYETATDTYTSLPQTIIGDGTAISAWSMKGNMTQSGTPTPANPIYPTECGEKTANLLDYTKSETGGIDASGNLIDSPNLWRSTVYTPIDNSKNYTISFQQVSNLSKVRVNYYQADKTHISRQEFDALSVDEGQLVIPNNAAFIKWTLYALATINISFVASINLMLNEGTTALSYEPYGYKIPILSNGNTYPVYLSEPIRKIGDSVDTAPSTGTASRVIEKLVLTGEEGVVITSNGSFYISNSLYLRTEGITTVCSHYTTIPNRSSVPTTDKTVCLYIDGSRIYIRDTTYTTTTDFQAYLAAQYANGTPVTIWYVLATPTTETFTAPSIPTSGSPQSFDVSTTLKPSEVSLTYHGWHEHEDTKFTT